MSKEHPIQMGFHGGEISPMMDMRHDTEGRKVSVGLMENFMCHQQGPAETRRGMQYVADVVGQQGRIFPYYVDTFSNFIVTATTLLLTVIDRNGFTSHDDLIANGDFLDGEEGWTVVEVGTGDVIITAGICSLYGGTAPNHQANIYQSIVVELDHLYILNILLAGGVGELHVQIGTSPGTGDIYDQIHAGAANIQVPFEPEVTTVVVELTVYGGSGMTKLIDTILCYDTDNIPEPIEFPSPWHTSYEIATIQSKMAPGSMDLFFTSATAQPQVLTYNKELRDWDFAEWLPANHPVEWNTSMPVCLEFYQGRLWMGGGHLFPEHFWASKVGDYHDFDLGDGTDPSDGISLKMDQRGSIFWIVGARELLFGTENAEHIATAQEGVLHAGDFQMTKQSSYGSIRMMPVQVASSVIFVSPDGRRVLSIMYQDERKAWVAKDLTFAAEHLTEGADRILQLYYSGSPNSILFAATLSGKVIAGTYRLENEDTGWHQHTTHGVVKSACMMPFGGRDEIWVLVDRDDQGEMLSLERGFAGGEPELDIKLDSFKLFDFLEPTSLITGLEHLAGFTVDALVDGAVHRPMVVEADGTLQLDYAGTSIAVGIRYVSRIVTLPRDDGMSLGGFSSGSGRLAMKRWNKIWVRIYNSWKPKINGQRPPERTAASPMGQIEDRATENVQVTQLGFERDQVITIEQELPVKTMVIGIFGEVEQDGA